MLRDGRAEVMSSGGAYSGWQPQFPEQQPAMAERLGNYYRESPYVELGDAGGGDDEEEEVAT